MERVMGWQTSEDITRKEAIEYAIEKHIKEQRRFFEARFTMMTDDELEEYLYDEDKFVVLRISRESII